MVGKGRAGPEERGRPRQWRHLRFPDSSKDSGGSDILNTDRGETGKVFDGKEQGGGGGGGGGRARWY